MGLVEGFNLPLCIIPLEILENYGERVKRFYHDGGKRRLEEYVKGIENNFNRKIKDLGWDDEEGLTNITLSPSIGLDLGDGRYVFHNMENTNLPEAKVMFEIAKKYIELLNEKLK